MKVDLKSPFFGLNTGRNASWCESAKLGLFYGLWNAPTSFTDHVLAPTLGSLQVIAKAILAILSNLVACVVLVFVWIIIQSIILGVGLLGLLRRAEHTP